VAVSVVQVGQPCDSGSAVAMVRYCVDQFAGNNVCRDDDGDGSGTCEQRPGAGSPCASASCAGDSFCNDSDQCERLPSEGESCEASFRCADDLDCDDETAICTVPAPPSEPTVCPA
jgi:hypothetical protein